MPKEQVTTTERDHIREIFDEIGLDMEKINPNILRRLLLLNEKTETFWGLDFQKNLCAPDPAPNLRTADELLSDGPRFLLKPRRIEFVRLFFLVSGMYWFRFTVS